jgi:hypothetical protein
VQGWAVPLKGTYAHRSHHAFVDPATNKGEKPRQLRRPQAFWITMK